jgi:hypothetical protein
VLRQNFSFFNVGKAKRKAKTDCLHILKQKKSSCDDSSQDDDEDVLKKLQLNKLSCHCEMNDVIMINDHRNNQWG